MILTCFSVRAGNEVFVNAVVDQHLVLEAPVDYHLLDAEKPLTNSTITLRHPNAWLFFDNVRPSDVKQNFIQFIKVNETTFVDGQNGKVAIYGNGTVLIPNEATSNPLIIFTEEGFQGDSMVISLYTLFNNLGAFDDRVRSFRLKRGFMATLATSKDGTGYSRVFIADKEDLNYEKLPSELTATVSFLRVFEHQWVSKKGWCGWDAGEIDLSGATWYYDWNSGGNTTDNVEYTPIKQNAGWPSWSSINSKRNVSHLLGYNEPDHTEQSNVSVEEAIANWPDFMESGLRLGAPATTNFNWLYSFIDQCDALNYRVDFVAIHAYWGGKTPANWYNDLKYIHERTGRPLWITEWNNGANWTNEWWPDDPSILTDRNAAKQLSDLKAILTVLDTAHFVERYSIYNWVEDARAMILNGQLTPAGEYYAQNPSAIAYDGINEVVPGKWNYRAPKLTNRYLSLANVIKLNWTDDNDGLSLGYKLEKKVNNGSFETIFETNDLNITSFNDSIDDSLNGTITYRVRLKTVYDTYEESNESSYFQLGSDDNLRIANLSFSDTEWNSCLITNEYDNKPMVLMGPTTFNNTLGLTARMNAVQTSSFKFRLAPWYYQKDKVLTKSEKVALAALPAGRYNFGGLEAEVNEIEGVDANWINISFDKPFGKVPVVFCTQVSNLTSIPTTPVIQNVTVSGFDVAIKCEEAISSTIIKAEAINYLAIEKGEGVVDQRRIIVGASDESGTGISTAPYPVSYDENITEPAVFAALQTSSDEFASTLRYYLSGNNELSFLKQRELSGLPSTVATDQLGWMIVDLAEDQKVGTEGKLTHDCLHFYPNPASGRVYFVSDEMKEVEIRDLTGELVLKHTVAKQLNIENLIPGNYLICINGKIDKLLVH